MRQRGWAMVLLPSLAAVLFVGTAVALRSRASGRSGTLAYRNDMAKIVIREEGVYRVGLAELKQVIPDLEHLGVDHLRLTQSGEEVGYYVQGDSLIFYGHASASRYTPVQTYMLKSGHPGMSMTQRAAAPSAKTEDVAVGMSAHFEQNQIYDSRASLIAADSPDLSEPWFWSTIQIEDQVEATVKLDHQPLGTALIRLRLVGVTSDDMVAPDHDMSLSVNGEPIGNVSWDGQQHHLAILNVPSGLMHEGDNKILLDNSAPGQTTIDISRLDWIEIDFAADPIAVNDRLAIRSPGGSLVASGFAQRPYILDISDPNHPELLVDWTFSQEDGSVSFETAKEVPILAVGPNAVLEPERILPVRDSDLRNPSTQADMIVITTDTLAPHLASLIEAKRRQGIRARVIPVEAIYDEFGEGAAEPDSITSFIRFASTQWPEPRPGYVLLVGDTTYDYRGYLETPSTNLVPAPMVAVDYSGETISDSRLADVDSDGIPELAIGRWPVVNGVQVRSLVERTRTYEESMASGRALFTADGTSLEFASLSNSIIEFSDFASPELVRLYGSTSSEVVDAWNEGAWFVSYVGHGSLDRWGQEDVFTTSTVDHLAPVSPPPLVVQLTCLTGYFAHPSSPSLAEAMLLYDKGPALVIASTSLSLSESQTPFAINLFRELEAPDVTTVGEALTRAKQGLDVSHDDALRQVSETFTLLGDPSARIVRPDLTARAPSSATIP